jgi:hypothetical protein
MYTYVFLNVCGFIFVFFFFFTLSLLLFVLLDLRTRAEEFCIHDRIEMPIIYAIGALATANLLRRAQTCLFL